MARSVILHVGPHKTGSTAIQKALFENRNALSRRGVMYPSAGIELFGHHELVASAREWANKLDRAALAEELQSCPVAVVSSENVVHLSLSALQRLRDDLQSDNIRIVYYLRRLVDLWPSHWQELVKHGRCPSFLEYVARVFLTPSDDDFQVIKQLEQLQKLATVFGHDALHIVSYDLLQDDREDFARHFITTFLDTPAHDVLVQTERVNASKRGWVVELIRCLNILHQQQQGVPASSAIRLATLRDLGRKSIDFCDEFEDVYEKYKQPIHLRNDDVSVRFLQARVIRQFKDRIVGDQDAGVKSYMRSVVREAYTFTFPMSGYFSLRKKIIEYYQYVWDDILKKAHL